MKKLDAVQLLDDLSMGGVTRGLAVFEEADIAAVMRSRVVEVDPSRRIAPRLNADLILLHFTPRWNALPFLASLRLRNPGARIVHIEHSYTRAWAASHVPHPGRFRAMLRLWHQGCDEVIAVSHGQAEWLREVMGLPRAPRVIHPWGGDLGLDRVILPTPRTGAPLRLAAYGRFAAQKGFDLLIAAMALLPAESYALELGGMGPQQDLLEQMARDLPNVRFFGKVTDIAAFLAPADVVIIPSRWEAFGQVAAESKMAGRPVMVANVDGLPEQAMSAAWVADCSSPASLAAAIRGIDPAGLFMAGAISRSAMADARWNRISGWLDLIAGLPQTLTPQPRAAA